MSNTTSPRLAAGFVLMDALIAVVVLVTGILALTLLQVTMLRSAAEARERSVGMTVAQNVLEERRASAQETSANYAGLVSQGSFSGGGCDFGAAGALVPPNTAGLPSTYRYCVEVQRFRSNGTTFVPVASSGAGAPAYGGVVPEFKQVTIHVGWRDSQGNWASLELGDAQSSIALINSNELLRRLLVPTTPQGGPQVRYAETDLTQNTNFIPIAVGDGSGTQIAATNPTPKVIGGGVAETSFQVFTYAASAGLANVQRQIDTRVVGCKCTSQNAPSLLAPDRTTGREGFLTRPVRASYWDGRGYTEPKGATYPTSDLIGTENSAFANGQQSPFCDLCCRDHHDPASVAALDADEVPRFDPYRASHTHYINPAADTPSDRISVAGQNYEEVCRVIRVNGIYRVSQDPLLDHYAYIPTDNNAINFTIETAKAGYGNFVQQYIQTRVLPLNGYSWANNRVNPVSALEDRNGLNAQAASPIDIGSSDRRYLQNRAILLDVLSKQAKDAMSECIDRGNGAPSDLMTCALRHTSFASINLTELTRWAVTAADPKPITISPKNFSVTTPAGTPVAGQVRDASGALTNAVGNALASINRSIATLADRLPVFFQGATDTLWPASDGQQFRYVGGPRPSFKISVTVTGLSYFDSRSGDSVAPYIGWFNGITQGDCTRITGTTRFECDLYSIANATNVSIRMFNFHQQLSVERNGFSCGRVRADRPQCNLFRANTLTGPGGISLTSGLTSPAFRTASSPGKPRDDEATASLGTAVDGNAYAVAFQASTSNPFKAPASCDVITGQPVFTFQDQECRR